MVPSTLLFKGGPSLIDLLIDSSELRIAITGPRMLFERLQLVTTLSAFDGCAVPRLREFADSLEGNIHCGLMGIQRAVISVESHRSGGLLHIDLGHPNMYQSELALRTRTGETFQALIHRLLAPGVSRPFFVGLYATPATGHLEHNHGSSGEYGGGIRKRRSRHKGESHGHS